MIASNVIVCFLYGLFWSLRIVASTFGYVLGYVTLLINYGLQILTVFILIQALNGIKTVATDQSDVLIVNFRAMYLLVSVYLVYLVTIIFELFAWNDTHLSSKAFLTFNIIFYLVYTAMLSVLLFIFY